MSQNVEKVLIDVVFMMAEEKSGWWDLMEIKKRLKGEFEFDEEVDWITSRYISRMLQSIGINGTRKYSGRKQYLLERGFIREMAGRHGISFKNVENLKEAILDAIPEDDTIDEAELIQDFLDRGAQESRIIKILTALKRSGEIFEPHHGKYKKL